MSTENPTETQQANTAKHAPKKVEKKSDATRAAILQAALDLFRSQGYDATTMRAIAAEAGVSLGSAYYYFESKEHLVQGFYERIGLEQATAVLPKLAIETSLEGRALIFIETWIDVCAPYSSLSGKFFKFAAEPGSPLSPFSQESSPARQASIGLWKYIIDGSDAKMPTELRAELPELMWLAFMGIVLYWVHDDSPESQRTRLLARRLVPMVIKALELSRLPLVKSTVHDLVGLLQDLRSTSADPRETGKAEAAS
jgi:AcrR family transcriptional regulator